MEESTKKTSYEEIIGLLKNYAKQSSHPHRLTALSELLNMLKESFAYMDWVGFYLLDEKNKNLYLGDYIGSEACELISLEQGVCGKCAREKKSQLVSDVSKIPYHIACSTTTKSEIVVPYLDKSGSLIGVLDVDSDDLDSFSKTDDQYLKAALYLIALLP
jgi:L-methionine (R)-S-oxide reductase